MSKFVSAACAAILALATATARADFSGQTILGPLGPGSSVSGDLTGASDDNDGWFSGFPIFGIWDGGDDVWALNWPGGDLTVDLNYDTFLGEPDLFLYTPTNLDESTLDSIGGTGFDTVTLNSAAPGTYFVLIDTTAGFEGPYDLSVHPVPEPGTLDLGALALGGVALALGMRRRR